ncbi:MAG: hypothetical protein KBE26_08470, partial [Bacteroidales bacterium]|nr:hypothetical protein [Bacteroidales bacterium]
MKRSRKGNRLKLLVLAAAVVAVISVSAGIKSIKESTEEINEEPQELSLNLLISNDLNQLVETKKLDSQIEKFMRQWQIKGASLA